MLVVPWVVKAEAGRIYFLINPPRGVFDAWILPYPSHKLITHRHIIRNELGRDVTPIRGQPKPGAEESEGEHQDHAPEPTLKIHRRQGGLTVRSR